MMRALGAVSYRLCLGALAGLFLALMTSTFELRTWPFELLSHFVLQYLLAACFLCLAFLAIGRKTAAALALVVVFTFAADYQQAPHTLGDIASIPVGLAKASVTKDPGLPSHRLSLITHNVYRSNSRPEDVAAWLATRPAEVIALEELPDGMAGRLQALSHVYRHQFIIEPGSRLNSEFYAGRESLAILSIHPIIARAVVRPSGQGKISLLAQISVPGAEDPWIVVVHPPNPAGPARLPARDSYLFDLAGLIAELDGPVIVAGDFNVAPYAPAFPRFLSASRTSTSRDFPATWPSVLGPLGIPIDHVLVREARIIGLQALPAMGSDHRALKAEILLPALSEEWEYAGRP